MVGKVELNLLEVSPERGFVGFGSGLLICLLKFLEIFMLLNDGNHKIFGAAISSE